ncbi:hypothetical protein AWB69_04293 [Caballeronia udeis]|uniref:Uncharacterized protein n=1 Tax=Caballeronia udeis TaxID=1232866 RepID=A0A158HDQ3_9BURK|nr:hypothetical protein [Caballeronia udeis]SAL42495.1 hypothetical protein AWB69_04293 [Caballeronia udeis]
MNFGLLLPQLPHIQESRIFYDTMLSLGAPGLHQHAGFFSPYRRVPCGRIRKTRAAPGGVRNTVWPSYILSLFFPGPVVTWHTKECCCYRGLSDHLNAPFSIYIGGRGK